MALTAAQLNTLKRLHQEETLIKLTNVGDDNPTTIDEDVLEEAVDTAVAMFQRRGYDLSELHAEVLYYTILWLRPRWMWGEQEKAMHSEFVESYPHKMISTVSHSTVEPGKTGDRRHFSDTQLDALDNITGDRTTKGHPRGPS